jgi:hypothetical protein
MTAPLLLSPAPQEPLLATSIEGGLSIHQRHWNDTLESGLEGRGFPFTTSAAAADRDACFLPDLGRRSLSAAYFLMRVPES